MYRHELPSVRGYATILEIMRKGLAPKVISIFRLVLLLTSGLLLFFACADEYSYFYVGNQETRRELNVLFEKLEDGQISYQNRYIINKQIIDALYTHSEQEKINLFLTTQVKTYEDDPYNAYYLLLIAENYKTKGAYPFAAHYYERILRNYQDLFLEWRQSVSVHLTCLKNLIEMVEEPEVRVTYYKELIARFVDKIDYGNTFFSLAKTYEELGEWDLAMQAYKEFLKYPETQIQGMPDAYKEVSAMVSLYDLPNKDWAMEELDALVTRIKSAIWNKQTRFLNSLRSQVDFFARAWEAEEVTETELELISDLGHFLGNKINFLQELDRDSNDREAYLRSWGWGYRIRVWFLYFRKVNFPADPDIHGHWEWAGIYLGEKPF